MSEEYPCRCGETHTGDYAAYDYGHHNCFHDAQLIFIVGPAYDSNWRTWSFMCPDCGKVFSFDPEQ